MSLRGDAPIARPVEPPNAGDVVALPPPVLEGGVIVPHQFFVTTPTPHPHHTQIAVGDDPDELAAVKNGQWRMLCCFMTAAACVSVCSAPTVCAPDVMYFSMGMAIVMT